MRLLRVAIASYSQKGKKEEAKKTALDYYRRSRVPTSHLWSELYNDGPVGHRIYKAITSHIHGLSPRCGYCQDRIFHESNGNVDHILPAAIYPQFTFEYLNLVRACVTCNMLKLDDDYYELVPANGNTYSARVNAVKCFHPRNHSFSDHVERLIVQTNHLHFRAYLGKTPEGVKICSLLLKRVSEFEVKATVNPGVADAARKLNSVLQAHGVTASQKAKDLLKDLIANL